MSDRFEETRRIWKQRFEEWQSSGQKITKWCQENNLDYKAFLYWKRRFLQKTLSHASFTELTDTKKCTIRIEYRDVRICLESSNLKQCLAVLADFKC
jgi:hypothetical protein